MSYKPKQITELYAWICKEADGGDGLPAVDLGGGFPMPMIGADRARVESLRPFAAEIVLTMGHPIKLVRFHQMEVLEELEPTVRITRA